jgi:hypothetical protein
MKNKSNPVCYRNACNTPAEWNVYIAEEQHA